MCEGRAMLEDRLLKAKEELLKDPDYSDEKALNIALMAAWDRINLGVDDRYEARMMSDKEQEDRDKFWDHLV